MDDLNFIAARGAQERAEAQRQQYGARIQELERLGATSELAEYLVSLEIRIAELEQRLAAGR
jgi:transcription elongation GreA/GreB family factor